MIRDRAWRRHIEEKVVIRRLRHKCQNDYWWRFEDVNGIQKCIGTRFPVLQRIVLSIRVSYADEGKMNKVITIKVS